MDRPGRAARAAEAQAFLEARIVESSAMQQDRLRDRPGAEIQDAIDALGTPELRQLFTLWKQLEPLAMPPLP